MSETLTRRYYYHDDFNGQHYFEVSIAVENSVQKHFATRYLDNLTHMEASRLIDADPPIEVSGCAVKAIQV